MKKWAVYVSIIALGAVVFAPLSYSQEEVENVVIQVSPSALILGAPGARVTVHADIAYSAVVGSSVTLNGVPAVATFADDCGNLVAKFAQEEIEAIVAPPSATMTLVGTRVDGVTFSGSDTIMVKDIGKSQK